MNRITIILLLMIYKSSTAQTLTYWENGDIVKAHETAENGLLMKTFFVQGKYREAIEVFKAIRSPRREYFDLAIYAYIHLKEYEQAFLLAKQKGSRISAYLREFVVNKFRIIADTTYSIPFADDKKILSDHWPGIAATINGISCLIRFDTGGSYMVTGIEAAKKLGIPLKNKHTNMHAATKVKGWLSVIDSMSFDQGPSFCNIPVTILESLGDYIIFGTNILEQFLTTVDYLNKRFIFTPRNNAQLVKEHYEMLPAKHTKLPFYLWADHFMFAKGKLGDYDSMTLFFDSGLITMTEVNGTLKQASFMASKESLLKWDLGNKFSKSTFIPTNYSLEVAGLSQPDILIWYDHKLKKDWNFGGVRINGLISHAWLKNYTWTLDFDRMEYTFGVKD